MSLVQHFNNQLYNFVNALENKFPENNDLYKYRLSLTIIKNSNNKYIYKLFKTQIHTQYRNELLNKNIHLLLKNINNNESFLSSMNFNNIWYNLDEESQDAILDYLKLLTKICDKIDLDSNTN